MNLRIRIGNRLKKIILGFKGAKLHTGSQVYCSVEIQNSKGFVLGENAIIYKNCTIYNNTAGNFEMGSSSHIAPFGYFLIGGNSLKIGNDVAIGPFCSFFCITNSPRGENKLYRKNYFHDNIIVGNNVFIGSHCVVLAGTIIHDNVVVGANSMVSGELETGWIYAGTPAKKIKKVSQE